MTEPTNKKFKFLSIFSIILLIVIAILSYRLYELSAVSKSSIDKNSSTESLETPINYSPSSSRKGTYTLNSHNNRPTWDPYTEIERMQEYINQLFSLTIDRFYEHDSDDDLQRFNFNLNAEVEEDNHFYIFNFSIPNVKPDSIDVNVTEKQLQLKGISEQSLEESDSQGNLIQSETQSTSFLRTIDFPEKVDPNSLEKKVENGLLQIKLKKIS